MKNFIGSITFMFMLKNATDLDASANSTKSGYILNTNASVDRRITDKRFRFCNFHIK